MGPTRKRDLTAAVVGAAAVGYLLVAVLYRWFPPITVWTGLSLLAVAVAEALWARYVRVKISDGEIGDGPGWLHPLVVARSLMVAKASAWVGALVTGWWIGVLAYFLPRRSWLTASMAPPSLTTVPRRAGMRRDGPQGHLIGPAIAVNRHRRIRVSPTRPVKPIRVPMSPRRSRMTRSVGPSRPTADERSIRCRSWIRAAHLLVSVCSTSNVPRPRCANCCTRSARIRIGTAW